ncbi:hypothetical protein FGG08_003446 [Glutinoglossum americanum]|uniref:NAD(P)-binding protein n=1 Tax=Glutinoglossum americanum TaxID=1670608 RepID=A0A9P8I7P2_9PEZI|nr:hypothetical protein FGG08_003446 [Glutinoglossum americanum]
MTEDPYLESLEDLTGKVAIVTGGAASIGLETTILLAQKGCTVYIASRNPTRATSGIDAAVARLSPDVRGRIAFHHLDLSTVSGAIKSANAFLSRENARLDILVGNAAVLTSAYSLGLDGVESTFATNVLGHYAFITTLLPLMKKAEEASVVVVNSMAYARAPRIDYGELLRERRETGEDGSSIIHIRGGLARYGVSKLGLMYFARELDRRLRAEGILTIKVNSCHPGVVGSTSLGCDTLNPVGKFLEPYIKSFVNLIGNSTTDAAKTQVFLAASKRVHEDDVHGEYWVPLFSWSSRYCECKSEAITKVAADEEEQRKLWAFCEEIVGKVSGEEGISPYDSTPSAEL